MQLNIWVIVFLVIDDLCPIQQDPLHFAWPKANHIGLGDLVVYIPYNNIQSTLSGLDLMMYVSYDNIQ